MRPVDRDQREKDVDQGQVVELADRQRAAAQGQLQDRHIRGVILLDERRIDARGHGAEDGLHHGGDLRDGLADRSSRLEVDFLDCQTRQRLRLDVLDVRDHRGDHRLADAYDPPLHLL